MALLLDIQRLLEHRLVVRKEYGLPYDAARGKRHMLPRIWHEAGMLQGVEIGTFRGDFAKLIIDQCPGVRLTCIDPYLPTSGGKTQEMQERYYQEACSKVGRENILRAPSLQAVQGFGDRSLDWVWIDGDHAFDACVQDIIQWSQKVRSGGMICVHDYDGHQCGVIEAVRGYTTCHHIKDWCVLREYPSTAIWINP